MATPSLESTSPSPSAPSGGPSSSVLDIPLTRVRLTDPLRWLQHGWRDFRLCPHIGLCFGLGFALMGHALWHVFHHAPAYVLGLSAGFLLLGPFLCLGLYAASRALAQGETPSLRAVLVAWYPSLSATAIFATLLLILELLWGRASLVVFAVTMKVMPTGENLFAILLSTANLDFVVAYLAVGLVFAGLIFVTSAISLPMILDRDTDAISAALTSFRACLQNPLPMLTWGMLISVLTLLAMLPAFTGLVVIAPVLGHATWHAYRHIVPSTTE